MYPACATPDQASIRFIERCAIAPAFPTMIDVTASAASAGPQSVWSEIRPSSKNRRMIAPTPVTTFMAVATKAAAFAIILRFVDEGLISAQTYAGPALAALAGTAIPLAHDG